MIRGSAAFIAAVVFLGGIASACASTAGGPQAWIDKPLPNTTAPLAPLTIIAHASHGGGVASVEFSVNGEPYRSVQADGGRLVWREVEWNPPGAGTYRIGARGVGNDGSEGEFDIVLLTISGEATAAPASTAAAAAMAATATLPTQSATSTRVTPTSVTPTVQVAPGVVAKMDANCREGASSAFDVYGSLLSGQRATLKGRLEDNSWLLVRLPDRSNNCWIAASVVEVQGDLNSVGIASAPQPPAQVEQPPPASVQPPPEIETPPTAQVIEMPTITVDDTKPVFHKIDGDLEKCPSRRVKVITAVTDESGLSSVVASWSIDGGGSGQVTLSLAGSEYWAMIDPGVKEGTLRVRFAATDASSARNWVQSDWLLMGIPACIE